MALLILGIILFIALVVVHELGHFWAARRGGVEAEEFGIFFPPRLYKRKTKKGWLFSVGLLPLGGFVKLKGEHDSDKAPGSFGAAKTGTKVKIMLAGVFMNLVAALMLFTALAWLGMPQLVSNQFTVKSDTKIVKNEVLVGYVEPDSPAAKAGLKSGDVLMGYGSTPCGPDMVCHDLRSAKQLQTATQTFEDLDMTIAYKRAGQIHLTTAHLRSDADIAASLKTDSPKGHLGVSPTEYTLQRSTWSAPVVAVGLTAQLTSLTFQGLGHALAGLGGIVAGFFTGNHAAREQAQTTASNQVSGPVGIFVILKSGSLLGYQFMLMIIAVISLTLAIMNVLPIPALDGGRLFVIGISRLLRKRLTQKAEEAIYASGFAVLMLLIIVITIVDVKRFF